MTLLVTLLAVAVAILTLLVAGLLRSHAAILQRLHELGAGLEDDRSAAAHPGGQAPDSPAAPTTTRPARPSADERPASDVSGADLDGGATGIRVGNRDQDTVLAFLSSGCKTCEPFWEALADPGLPDDTRLVIVTKDAAEESPSALGRLAPARTTVVMSSQAWGDYDVPGSPYVVHVDGATARIRGEGTGADWPSVRRMLEQATGDTRHPARTRPERTTTKAAADAQREREVDRELLTAGIKPGDPSLYRRADDTGVANGEPR